MIAASLESACACPTDAMATISDSLVAAATPTSRRLAIAAGGTLARLMDLRVRAIAEHVLVGLHRRIREVLPAILRDDPARPKVDDADDADEQHHDGPCS